MRSRITRHLWPVLGEPIPVRRQPDGASDPETIAPETPPLELSGRDYAIFLLRLAAEVEHGLMVQYLFAAYSLDPPGAPAAQRSMVTAGRRRSSASPRRRWPISSRCRTCSPRSADRCSSTARSFRTTTSSTHPASGCGR